VDGGNAGGTNVAYAIGGSMDGRIIPGDRPVVEVPTVSNPPVIAIDWGPSPTLRSRYTVEVYHLHRYMVGGIPVAAYILDGIDPSGASQRVALLFGEE
jgi:hypothetical protein